MFCKHYGTPLKETDDFCANCGNKVNEKKFTTATITQKITPNYNLVDTNFLC